MTPILIHGAPPGGDAHCNDSLEWPSLGRNLRAGELAKDEEMHEGECIHEQRRRIQNCFGQNTQKWGWDANLRRPLPWNEKQREVPSNSTSTRNQPEGLQKR